MPVTIIYLHFIFITMKKLLAFGAIIFFINTALAQDFNQYQRSLMVSGNDTLRYRILYPDNYSAAISYPLLLFLHGAGERGTDNEKQLIHGGDLFLKEEIRKSFPAIIIFPQCPADTNWSYFEASMDPITNSRDHFFPFHPEAAYPERMVKQLADSLVEKGIADKNRIYIGGLSRGAFATYDLLIRYPGFFAAAFTICGGCNTQLMSEKANKIPLWIFHGGKDNVVRPDYDRQLYQLLSQQNAPVEYTEYPEANHNSWDSAFAEPQLLPWLFSHHQ
jgi:predicted peptidase